MSRSSTNRAALLWDESFLWGLMAYKALNACGLGCDLVRAEDVKKGILDSYRLLFVPGGWASNKIKRLGDEGVSAIKNFVFNGGNYLGFCGGAGLATRDGIGLLGIRRMPTKDRVPSFSGRIRLLCDGHEIWGAAGQDTDIFHVWWPSQFVVEDPEIRILAKYGMAMPDAFSSDLNIGDVEASSDWRQLEEIYRINLNPGRLIKEPALVEGRFGRGRALLSLIHFDTPGDANSAAVFGRLWKYMGGGPKQPDISPPSVPMPVSLAAPAESEIGPITSMADRLRLISSDIIGLGERNFLWFMRTPMMMQWRRGVRGLEYCTLHVMASEAAGLIASVLKKSGGAEIEKQFRERLDKILAMLLPFSEKAKRLLVLERLSMQKDPITYERCDDPEIQALRAELFSTAKSHGGLFKELLDEVDELIFILISIKEGLSWQRH